MPLKIGQNLVVTTATDSLHVRASADKSSEANIVGELARGSVCTFESGPHNGAWYEVSQGGLRGYSASAYLEPVAESERGAPSTSDAPGESPPSRTGIKVAAGLLLAGVLAAWHFNRR